jgi:hypothetical protein
MNDFSDLLGTPYASVSKIAPVKDKKIKFIFLKILKQLISLRISKVLQIHILSAKTQIPL